MFKNLLDKASNATKDINIKSSLDNAQKTIGGMIDGAKNSTESIIEKSWPKIEAVLYEGLIGLAESKLKDDKSLVSAFETAYEIMPTVIRLSISRDTFVDFCLTRKESILQKLSVYKDEKTNITSLSSPNNESVNKSIKLIESESIYQNLLPELIALCITADGKIEESEIELATAIIEDDDFIRDKEQALKSLSDNIESLMTKKQKSNAIFKMQSASIISKIPKVESSEEKERLNIIIEGMLSSVNESELSETKVVTDSIQKSLLFKV